MSVKTLEVKATYSYVYNIEKVDLAAQETETLDRDVELADAIQKKIAYEAIEVSANVHYFIVVAATVATE